MVPDRSVDRTFATLFHCIVVLEMVPDRPVDFHDVTFMSRL